MLNNSPCVTAAIAVIMRMDYGKFARNSRNTILGSKKPK